ncbi:hypothetical protein CXB40_15590 [Pseudomonas syringae pv. avii]|nr:hypothetical protein CXB40_15590 [Pseudomonas syringae pv. avii]
MLMLMLWERACSRMRALGLPDSPRRFLREQARSHRFIVYAIRSIPWRKCHAPAPPLQSCSERLRPYWPLCCTRVVRAGDQGRV